MPAATDVAVDHPVDPGWSDADVADAARAGSLAAFEILWHRHHPYVVETVQAMSPTSDAVSVASQVFARLFTVMRRGGGPASYFRSYLDSTVRYLLATPGPLPIRAGRAPAPALAPISGPRAESRKVMLRWADELRSSSDASAAVTPNDAASITPSGAAAVIAEPVG